MFFDPVIVFDHLFQTINVISHVQIPPNNDDSALDLAYQVARDKIQTICNELNSPGVPLPPQGPITLNNTYTSNVGQTGYEAYVQTLKEKIIEGQIIQAVPSQRLARPTSLHPFNIYRHLRTVNPSPYMFYIDCGDFQLSELRLNSLSSLKMAVSSPIRSLEPSDVASRQTKMNALPTHCDTQ